MIKFIGRYRNVYSNLLEDKEDENKYIIESE